MRRVSMMAVSGTLVAAIAAGTAAAALTEQEALDAVETFITGWNSRNPATFAATLNYPHVRPAAQGGGRVFANAEEYAAATSFDQALASGWSYSRFDSKRVVHLEGNKAHVAGQYSRYREDDSVIWTNQVTYVVTEVDGSIGIQARFAAGFVPASEEERKEAEWAGIEVVKAFLVAFNARDKQAWAATLNYPHVRLAGQRVRVSETPEEFIEAFDFSRFADRLGWHHSLWHSVEAVQVSSTGVNVALTVTRYEPDGDPIHSFKTLYLVTLQDGHWGIRARTSFAP